MEINKHDGLLVTLASKASKKGAGIDVVVLLTSFEHPEHEKITSSDNVIFNSNINRKPVVKRNCVQGLKLKHLFLRTRPLLGNPWPTVNPRRNVIMWTLTFVDRSLRGVVVTLRARRTATEAPVW